MPRPAADPATLTVAVAGAANFVAAAVLERLDADRSITRLIGLDCDEPPMPVAKLDFRTVDVRDPLLSVALDEADVVVHVALTLGPLESEDTMFAINVHGTRNLLEAASKAGVKRFVHISTAAVYGAHDVNLVPLTEDEPLRANPDFSWAYHHQLAEELVQAWAENHPDAVVTIFRPVTTLGPGADNFVARHFEQPVLPVVRDNLPPVQFLHVDDLAAAVHIAVTRDMAGVFNVAPDGWVTTQELAHLLGKRTVSVPEALAFPAARTLWSHRVLGAPAGALRYLMYPWVLTSDRLHEFGWSASRSNREVLREFAVEHRPFVSMGPWRFRRRTVHRLATAATLGGAFLVFRGMRRVINSRRRP
ncbi:MAG: NAD-dependent epimerase/dehydratase family protein [Nitriliruptorales bacterium]|nr:NAD-dependent epimerase/dehydratase family protein [Nitriliruptorales bacterium]